MSRPLDSPRHLLFSANVNNVGPNVSQSLASMAPSPFSKAEDRIPVARYHAQAGHLGKRVFDLSHEGCFFCVVHLLWVDELPHLIPIPVSPAGLEA